MTESLEVVLAGLRAAAEPTRLRLLALLSQAEMTVGEICVVIGQSQPRVSRHLKLLCEAQLLDRFREQHFVYYRVPVEGAGQILVAQLLGLVAKDDATLARDRIRLERLMTERGVRAASEWQIDHAMAPESSVAEVNELVLAELGEEPVGRLLDIGTGAGHLLKAFAPRASRAIGLDISSDALRLARSNVHGAGLSHCELQRGDMYDLPFTGASFDTVAIDRVLASAEQPFAVVAEAARMLDRSGRLLLIEDFDALSDHLQSNPLALLREWFNKLGLHCERIRPADTQAAHLIIAIGRRVAAERRAA